MNKRNNSTAPSAAGSGLVVEQLLTLHQQLCVPQHDYRTVDGTQFRRLNISWYNAAVKSLRGVGYSVLGDVQRNVPLLPEQEPTFLRLAVSRDGSTGALIWHTLRQRQVRLRELFKTFAWCRGRLDMLLLSELGDGSFCYTSTEPLLFDFAEGIVGQHLPLLIPVHLLALRHNQLLWGKTRSAPGLAPLKLRTQPELIATINAFQGQKATARMAQGFFSRTELWRLGHDAAMAAKLIAQASGRQQPNLPRDSAVMAVES